jgi:hypothetical protein
VVEGGLGLGYSHVVVVVIRVLNFGIDREEHRDVLPLLLLALVMRLYYSVLLVLLYSTVKVFLLLLVCVYAEFQFSILHKTEFYVQPMELDIS